MNNKLTELKSHFKQLAQEDYETFVKALIAFEKDLDDEPTLQKMYDAYYENDAMNLLNDGFDEMMQEEKK